MAKTKCVLCGKEYRMNADGTMRAHLTSCLKNRKQFDPERLDSLDFDPNTATRDKRGGCGTGPTASIGDRVTYLHAACRNNDAKLAQDLGIEIAVLNAGETRIDEFDGLIKHEAPIGETMTRLVRHANL